jgi:Histidine phosphatase superfamily (branch 2)
MEVYRRRKPDHEGDVELAGLLDAPEDGSADTPGRLPAIGNRTPDRASAEARELLTPPIDDDNVDAHWRRQRQRSGERELPTFITGCCFKSLCVSVMVLIALSPIALKLRKEGEELNKRRFHNDSFREKNPNVTALPVNEQAHYYCHASFPAALDSLNYTAPAKAVLRSVQIITRHGDRAPCNVLPHDHESNVTWYCLDSDPYDTAPLPVKTSHIRDEPEALRPAHLWQGNCDVCDLTGRGLTQHHMLGEALGAIYSQFIEIAPNTVYVRSTDYARTRQSAEAFIRGLMTVSLDAGTVNLRTGIDQTSDILRPQPTKCPVSATVTILLRLCNCSYTPSVL